MATAGWDLIPIEAGPTYPPHPLALMGLDSCLEIALDLVPDFGDCRGWLDSVREEESRTAVDVHEGQEATGSAAVVGPGIGRGQDVGLEEPPTSKRN